MKTIKLEDRVIYQIFPRSFYDSNNDGDGDLKGITAKLDHIKELGCNAIWLCPIYDTNFVDAGYDVLDYKNVWSKFGTLEDFNEMTTKAREKGIDIIMDIVLNHVSNEHDWFKKACESVENKEHNYFIWREKLSTEEQKAMSIFGGSAWEFVPSVNKYYFHLFAKEQVDLNWAHPDTIKAMSSVIDFWYDLGVRGFRFDAIKHIAKTFDNIDSNPAFAWCDGAVEYLKEFNKVALKGKEDAFILGESSGINVEETIKYGSGKDKVSDNFYNFCWWWIGWGRTGRNGYDANWDYRNFAKQFKEFQENEQIKPWMITNFLSNHDTSRSVSRWGSETFFRKESAKTHALLLMSAKGIPCIYYGEEIGLLNNIFSKREEFMDCDIHNGFAELVDQKKIYSESEMLKWCNINSRDSGRAIMQWDNSVNSGFNTGAKTWIKNCNRALEINVENDKKDPESIFNFYKTLINLRTEKFHDLFINGTAKVNLQKDGVIEVIRELNGQTMCFYINMTANELNFERVNGELILSSYSDNKNSEKYLRPYESIMILKG